MYILSCTGKKMFLHLIIWDFSLFKKKKDCHMAFIHTPLVPLFNETISLWVSGPSAQRHSTLDCPKKHGSLYQLFWTDKVVTKRFQLLQLDIFKLKRIHEMCFWYLDNNEPQLVLVSYHLCKSWLKPLIFTDAPCSEV